MKNFVCISVLVIDLRARFEPLTQMEDEWTLDSTKKKSPKSHNTESVA